MSRARDLADFASDSQVSADEIENNAVTTAKIADSNVTNAKLANSTVTLAGDSGSDSVALGETMTVAGGTGLTSTGSSNTITLNIDSTVATLTGTQTLTNKTINTASNTITITESDISDLQSYILADSTDTLTNKTISGSSNTLSNIGNASLTNSSITVTDGSTSTAVSLGGTITIQGTTNEIEISESSGTITIGLPSDTTIGNNLTIAGNLTVNGTTTTLNTTNTTVTDNLLELNSGVTSNANDSGILIERGSTGDNAIIAWDESADKFTLGTTTATASDTGNLTITTGTLVANLEATTATLGGSDIISTDNTKTLTNKTINTASNTITIVESDISDLGAYLENVSEDSTPQLGGSLDLNSNNITGTGNINITGSGTFSGDLTVDTNTLYVDSTNNRVGIGTTSPSSLLHIAQTSDDTGGGLQIRNTADSNSVFIYQDGTTTTFDSGSSGDQAFRLGNAERMRLNSSGYLGIGTSSPSSTLDVNGTVTATTFSGSGASLTSIPNSSLDNSSITINGTGVSLGGSITVSSSTAFNDLTNKTSGTGDYATTGDIVSGKNSGGVALTINDGKGNANVTFNHQNGVPEQNGNAARIEVNTDNSSGAHFEFEVGSGVTSGVSTNLTRVFEINESGVISTGYVRATGDITAFYSDSRLKDFHGTIPDALDKVNKLNGYYFTANERAKELGYTSDDMQVGVSAQEVESVLPEVVTLSAIDDPENYKTVKYDKMVALLIEAIKELKQKVEKLENA